MSLFMTMLGSTLKCHLVQGFLFVFCLFFTWYPFMNTRGNVKTWTSLTEGLVSLSVYAESLKLLSDALKGGDGCLVTKSCLICEPIHCSLLVSSVCGISKARILEWVTISSSRGSSWPRDRAHVGRPCIAGRFFTTEPPGKPSLKGWWSLTNKE